MNTVRPLLLTLFAMATLLAVPTAQAQVGNSSNVQFTVEGGVMWLDRTIVGPHRQDFNAEGDFITDEFSDARDSTPVLGAQLMFNMGNGFGVGAQGAWSPTSVDDANMYMYAGQVGYTLPSEYVTLFGSAGVGGATVTFGESDVFAGQGELEGLYVREDQTMLYVPLAVGFKTMLSNNLVLHTSLQDNVIFNAEVPFQDNSGLGFDTNEGNTHSLQLTAGLALQF